MGRSTSKEMDQEDRPGKNEARLLLSRHSFSKVGGTADARWCQSSLPGLFPSGTSQLRSQLAAHGGSVQGLSRGSLCFYILFTMCMQLAVPMVSRLGKVNVIIHISHYHLRE